MTPKLDCWYEDGTHCYCQDATIGGVGCFPLDPPKWNCSPPLPNCPKVAPNGGTPCNLQGTQCGFGLDSIKACTCTQGIVCENSLVWRWERAYCPTCAAPDTPVATPTGERPIALLAVGDLVYSVDHAAIVAVPLLSVQRTPVVAHHVMRVVLDTGRVLEISPGHPTADGRRFGHLTAGGALDEQHKVVSAELVPYQYDATYDVLPASTTHTYFAAGALIGSTLGEPEGAAAGYCQSRSNPRP